MDLQLSLLIAGIVLIVGGILFYIHVRRGDDLEQAAAALGLAFSREVDSSYLCQLGMFTPFAQADYRNISNCIYGESDDTEMRIFDYSYTTGHGEALDCHRETAIVFASGKLDLPAFRIERHSVSEKVHQLIGLPTKASGSQEVDFYTCHRFSQSHVLRGKSIADVESFFDDELLDYFERRQSLCVEGSHFQLICYRPGKRIRPAELKTFFEECFQIFLRISKRSQACAVVTVPDHSISSSVSTTLAN